MNAQSGGHVSMSVSSFSCCCIFETAERISVWNLILMVTQPDVGRISFWPSNGQRNSNLHGVQHEFVRWLERYSFSKH